MSFQFPSPADRRDYRSGQMLVVLGLVIAVFASVVLVVQLKGQHFGTLAGRYLKAGNALSGGTVSSSGVTVDPVTAYLDSQTDCLPTAYYAGRAAVGRVIYLMKRVTAAEDARLRSNSYSSKLIDVPSSVLTIDGKPMTLRAVNAGKVTAGGRNTYTLNIESYDSKLKTWSKVSAITCPRPCPAGSAIPNCSPP